MRPERQQAACEDFIDHCKDINFYVQWVSIGGFVFHLGWLEFFVLFCFVFGQSAGHVGS